MTKCNFNIKLKGSYEVGDCFLSVDNQLVMITYDNDSEKYLLVVIASKTKNENIMHKGEMWDSRRFDTLDSINSFINENENLIRHINSFTVTIND